MLDAARAAQAFAEGKIRSSLDTDQQFLFALYKAIEIIGEAASKITPTTRAEIPEIAWRDMIGMRNILIHGYFEIDLDQVWKAVVEDLPLLVAELEQIVPPEADS